MNDPPTSRTALNAAVRLEEESYPRYSRAPLPMMGQPYDLHDRLEILNLLGAYGHLFDGGYREAWLETLFAPDVRFRLTPPPGPLSPEPIVMEGRDGVRDWFARTPRVYRLLVESAGLDPMQAAVFHGIQNISVLEQTADRARIVANQYVGVRHAGLKPPFQYVGNVRIEGVLEKQPDGCWRITDWDVS